MVRPVVRTILVGSVALGAGFVLGVPSAMAQGGGLGGYGAMAGGPGSSMGGGMGAGTLAPFGGRFGSSMSSGMGGTEGLSFRARPSSAMSGTRTAFTIGPMGGGMGLGSSRRSFVLPDLGPSGFSGLGGDMRRPMSATGGMGVMPPSFGSPFRQPPSLLSPSAPGAGMSM